MIKIIIFLMLPVFATAQLDKAVDAKIQAFAGTLDSNYNVVKSSVTSFNIDTLISPVDKLAIYLVRITQYGATTIPGIQYVYVTNTKGVYSAPISPTNVKSGPSWLLTTVPGVGIVIRCNNTTGKSITWEYKRMNL